MTDRLLDRRWPVALAFAVALVVIWQLVTVGATLPRYILAPSEIVAGVADLVEQGELWPALGLSLRRQLIGFAIGASVGVVTGLLAGVFRPAESFFDTLVSLTYPLPKIALFPVIVVWLGFSDVSRVLIIAVSTFYPSFVNAFAGTRSINPQLLWVARNVGANRLRTFLQVVARAAMPSVAVGVRISLALSFTLTFATESIGASRGGLGALIDEGFDNLLYAQMYAGIACFALLGFMADLLYAQASGRLLRGQRTAALRAG